MRPGGSSPDSTLRTPSEGRRLTRAQRRAMSLERRDIGGTTTGSGIQFDTDPQSGHFLELTIDGSTTFDGSEPGADGYGGIAARSNWADTDDNSLMFVIDAIVSNDAVGSANGLYVHAQYAGTTNGNVALAIEASAETSVDGGLAAGVESFAHADGSGNARGWAFRAHAAGSTLAVGLQTDSCIYFEGDQDESTVPSTSGDNAAIYYRVHSGTKQLVASVNGTVTVLATG